MADPPSYEESRTGCDRPTNICKDDANELQRFSIHAEVSASRSQHVAAVVAKLLPRLKDRAKQGLSRSTLLLLPSDQAFSRKGQIVGFAEDELPILVQLEGRQDTMEFWAQDDAREELESQVLAAISNDVPNTTDKQPSLERLLPPPNMKALLFGRKRRAPEVKTGLQPVKRPVAVDVQLDDVHFRTETEYGLCQTLSGRAVLVIVNVR